MRIAKRAELFRKDCNVSVGTIEYKDDATLAEIENDLRETVKDWDYAYVTEYEDDLFPVWLENR